MTRHGDAWGDPPIRSVARRRLEELALARGVQVTDDMLDHLEREQLRMVLNHTAVGASLAAAYAVILASRLEGKVPAAWIAWWLAVKVILALPRMANVSNWWRELCLSNKHLTRLIYANLWLDGFVWGLAGYVIISGSLIAAAMVAVSLGCIASAAAFGFQSQFVATALYVVPILSQLIVYCLLRGDEFGITCGVGMVFLLSVTLMSAWRSERQLMTTLLLAHVNKIRELIVSIVNHELRTPLQVVMDCIDSLDDRVGRSPGGQKYVGRMREALGRIDAHLRDLDDVGHAGQEGLDADPVVFPLALLVSGVAQDYKAEAQRLEVDVEVTGRNVDVELFSAQVRIRQVLANLVGNAIKYSGPGKNVTATVEFNAAEHLLTMVVADNGPGIPAEDLKQIWAPFWRGKGHGSQPGKGLGLSIVQQIMAAVSGSVSVDSTVGAGTTFTVVIPVLTADEARMRKVLVVDDDAGVRDSLVGMLAKAGGDAVAADGGAQALKIFAEDPRVDTVLVDMQMPGMDGPTVGKRIEEFALKHSRTVSIVGMSAAIDARRLADNDFADFLFKPIKLADLRRLIALPPGVKRRR